MLMFKVLIIRLESYDVSYDVSTSKHHKVHTEHTEKLLFYDYSVVPVS